MKKALFVSLPTLLVVGFFALPVIADQRLVAFQGGIGVIPVSSAAGVQNLDGTFPNVNRNVVRGVNPAGTPWVIADLRADVRVDGTITVDGRGLLLAGGNNIGTTAGLSVRARLLCGLPPAAVTAHASGDVPLDAGGDFRIDDILTPVPPDPCANPVLLIVRVNPISGMMTWFAAGIPKQ